VRGWGCAVERRARGADRRFYGIYAPRRGAPYGRGCRAGGVYGYCPPARRPRTCHKLADPSAQPAGAGWRRRPTGCPFFADSPQKIWSGVSFIFALRENNRNRSSPMGFARHVGLRRAASTRHVGVDRCFLPLPGAGEGGVRGWVERAWATKYVGWIGDFAAPMSFGHPSGEVVDEGAYTYTAPSSTPSYLLIFAKRENNGGRDSGLAEDGHPTKSRPGETQCFIFTFRENNRVPIFLLKTAKKYGEVLLLFSRCAKIIGFGGSIRWSGRWRSMKWYMTGDGRGR